LRGVEAEIAIRQAAAPVEVRQTAQVVCVIHVRMLGIALDEPVAGIDRVVRLFALVVEIGQVQEGLLAVCAERRAAFQGRVHFLRLFIVAALQGALGLCVKPFRGPVREGVFAGGAACRQEAGQQQTGDAPEHGHRRHDHGRLEQGGALPQVRLPLLSAPYGIRRCKYGVCKQGRTSRYAKEREARACYAGFRLSPE